MLNEKRKILNFSAAAIWICFYFDVCSHHKNQGESITIWNKLFVLHAQHWAELSFYWWSLHWCVLTVTIIHTWNSCDREFVWISRKTKREIGFISIYCILQERHNLFCIYIIFIIIIIIRKYHSKRREQKMELSKIYWDRKPNIPIWIWIRMLRLYWNVWKVQFHF